jgi:hypothetical protein
MQLPALPPRRLAGAAGLARIAAAGVALAGAGVLAVATVAAPAPVPGPAGGPVPPGFRAVSMTFVSASEGAPGPAVRALHGATARPAAPG